MYKLFYFQRVINKINTINLQYCDPVSAFILNTFFSELFTIF